MRTEDFSNWLSTQPLKEKTQYMRLRALARVEAAHDCDLDVEYDTDHVDGLLLQFQYSAVDARQDRPNPTKMNMGNGEVRTQINWYRSHINSYRKFREAEEAGFVADDEFVPVAEDDADGQTFGLEADLEQALRENLIQLEPGLTLADGGKQRKVNSGFVDIVARGADGATVVIELKAGLTRPDAVAQVLGYMGDIQTEEDVAVRGYLIGTDHHKRVEAAARAVPDLHLRRYTYQFSFS